MGGVAIPDRGHLHRGVFFHVRLGGPILSVARRRGLPNEFRLAHFHRVRRDHPRLDPAQDSFLGETQYVSLVFGGTLAVVGYWIGQFIGRYLAVWPIRRYIKTL